MFCAIKRSYSVHHIIKYAGSYSQTYNSSLYNSPAPILFIPQNAVVRNCPLPAPLCLPFTWTCLVSCLRGCLCACVLMIVMVFHCRRRASNQFPTCSLTHLLVFRVFRTCCCFLFVMLRVDACLTACEIHKLHSSTCNFTENSYLSFLHLWLSVAVFLFFSDATIIWILTSCKLKKKHLKTYSNSKWSSMRHLMTLLLRKLKRSKWICRNCVHWAKTRRPFLISRKLFEL